jgi:hypothetical protein
MSCDGNANCTCGCCSGTSVQTPRGESNPPGLPAITYRTGAWATFNESMLARLSSSDYPALNGLKTRDDDDFSIALLDASSVMLDILTFYQERLANESYLRTATQRYSLTQLSRLIGYQPSPGVSASVYLAFTLTAAPGSPANPTTAAITIPAGTTAQSVPPQGQTPQMFQTSADILGKPDWNALAVQSGNPWTANNSQSSMYLSGTATQLQTGDAILIVGETGASGTATQPWLLALVTQVATDAVNNRTMVTWATPLGSYGDVSQGIPAMYAMRQKASLFGYNALNPEMLTPTIQGQLKDYLVSGYSEWDFKAANLSNAKKFLLDLDAVYSKVPARGWIVVFYPDPSSSPPISVGAFATQSVYHTSRSDFGMSGKITRVGLVPSPSIGMGLDALAMEGFYLQTRALSLLAQSEPLASSEQPLDHPLYGTLLDLETVREDLTNITAVAITGKSQKMMLNAGVSLTFTPYDNNGDVTLNPGDAITLMQPPIMFASDGSIPAWASSNSSVTLVIADPTGRTGEISAALSQFTLLPAGKSDPVVQEFALVSSIALTGTPARTRIVLQNPLLNCYDRIATTVNANVGVATAGSPVTELLGNGSAATPNQSFTLKQTPLTYVQAPTPSGAASSLRVTANGATWAEVPALYQQPPQAQVFETINLSGGSATVQFGDGIEGATLPTGSNNIIANYRVGIGSAGNAGAATITTLVDRPAGVKGVNNPMAATGGQDAQSADDIRANAPQTVLTLGRAVSITDYQNFAATFAGIAKASALWIPNGINRGVFLTVAAAGGAALPPGNVTLANLTAALRNYGNSNVALFVQSFYETLFGLNADILYDPRYNSAAVAASVMALLTSTYSFASRTFGQGVSGDEIAALIQSVQGVVAVNVNSVTVGPTSAAGDLGSAGYSVATWNTWIAQQKSVQRPKSHSANAICPYVPVAKIGALPVPAEILALNPDPSAVVLGVMA